MQNSLDDSLLAEFIDSFYGYGSYAGAYWFVGMEEGGGNSLADIQRRLAAWAQRGKHALEDVAAYHLALGYDQFFTGPPTKSQPTWNKLIRMVLGSRQPSVSLDQVKAYQRDSLGRWEHETCLLELLPLPSPSTGNWLYGQLATLPGLASREAYRKHYAPLRVEQLRQRISEHQPQAVVFYSFNAWYVNWWRTIAQVDFAVSDITGSKVYWGADAHTRYVIVPHPVSHGITNRYYQRVGQLLMEHWPGTA